MQMQKVKLSSHDCDSDLGHRKTDATARQTLRKGPLSTASLRGSSSPSLSRVAGAKGIARKEIHVTWVGQALVPKGMSLPLKPQRVESLRLH